MPIVSLIEMMDRARAGGYGVGYFEAWDSYSMEAVLEAAEEERSPVILGFGAMMADREWLDNSGVELLGATGSAIARRARVPVCLLFNEAQTMDQALKSMGAGFNSVMLDTSAWSWQDAVDAVRSLVHAAHAQGVAVEAELGRLPDATLDGIDRSAALLTDPEQAAEFMAVTGADCLAVSIGNVHLLTSEEAPVDLQRLTAIHHRVIQPLVIHGGTSFPNASIKSAIVCGVAKFNVGTALKKAFFEGARQKFQDLDVRQNVHDVLGSHKKADFMCTGKAAMKQAVVERMRLYGSSGRAEEYESA